MALAGLCSAAGFWISKTGLLENGACGSLVDKCTYVYKCVLARVVWEGEKWEGRGERLVVDVQFRDMRISRKATSCLGKKCVFLGRRQVVLKATGFSGSLGMYKTACLTLL